MWCAQSSPIPIVRRGLSSSCHTPTKYTILTIIVVAVCSVYARNCTREQRKMEIHTILCKQSSFHGREQYSFPFFGGKQPTTEGGNFPSRFALAGGANERIRMENIVPHSHNAPQSALERRGGLFSAALRGGLPRLFTMGAIMWVSPSNGAE